MKKLTDFFKSTNKNKTVDIEKADNQRSIDLSKSKSQSKSSSLVSVFPRYV